MIWAICDGNLLSLRKKNNNDTFYFKLFDLFNNKSKIMFLFQQKLCFTESYSDPKDTPSWLFDDKTTLTLTLSEF